MVGEYVAVERVSVIVEVVDKVDVCVAVLVQVIMKVSVDVEVGTGVGVVDLVQVTV